MKPHSNTKKEVRRSLISWKHAVKKTQTKCYITGSTEKLEIHHANKSFSEIFNEAHEILNIEYHKEVKDYDEADFQALIDEVVNAHKDVVPVVLTQEVHSAIHKKYGTHVSMDQIEEFKAEYDAVKTCPYKK